MNRLKHCVVVAAQLTLPPSDHVSLVRCRKEHIPSRLSPCWICYSPATGLLPASAVCSALLLITYLLYNPYCAPVHYCGCCEVHEHSRAAASSSWRGVKAKQSPRAHHPHRSLAGVAQHTLLLLLHSEISGAPWISCRNLPLKRLI